MSKPLRAVVVNLSAAQLTEILGMPKGTRVVDVGVSWVHSGVQLVVEAEGLQPVAEGQVYPPGTLVIRQDSAAARPRVVEVRRL